MSDRHGLGQAVLLLRPRVPVWVTGSPEECACEDATVPLACEQGWGRPGAEVPRTSELSVAGHGVPHCPVRGRHRHKARLRSATPVSSVRASRAWSVTSSGQRLKVVEVLCRVNVRRFSPRSRHRRHVRGTRCPSPPRRPGWTCPPHVTVTVSVSASAPRGASVSARSPAVPVSLPPPPFPTPNVAFDTKSPREWLLSAGCSHGGTSVPSAGRRAQRSCGTPQAPERRPASAGWGRPVRAGPRAPVSAWWAGPRGPGSLGTAPPPGFRLAQFSGLRATSGGLGDGAVTLP